MQAMMKQAGIDMGDFEAENQDPELAALEKLYNKSKMVITNFTFIDMNGNYSDDEMDDDALLAELGDHDEESKGS